jgi:UDP-N-acetylglucosamine 2-epimerase
MSKLSIGILTGCESDKHLSERIIIELKTIGLESKYIYLKQNDIVLSYRIVDMLYNKFNFILAVGDRKEQLGGVLAAFDHKLLIGHLYAGDLNTGVSDDIHRAAITLYSNIQFCSCPESTENTIKLMRAAGLVPDANYIGATHFDNVDIKKLNKVNTDYEPYTPYALISINSEMENSDDKLIEETLVIALSCAYPINYLITKGNNDNEKIEDILFKELSKQNRIVAKQPRVNQVIYLSQIKFCKYFITNSSAAIYEAPFLMNQDNILIVGKRNRKRTQVSDLVHDGRASQRVASLIKIFLEAKI